MIATNKEPKSHKYSISLKRDMGEWFDELLKAVPGKSPSALVQRFLQPAFDAYFAEKLYAEKTMAAGLKIAEPVAEYRKS